VVCFSSFNALCWNETRRHAQRLTAALPALILLHFMLLAREERECRSAAIERCVRGVVSHTNTQGVDVPSCLPRTTLPHPKQVAASHGLFVNLGAVLLQLCGPFLAPSSGLFWKRVDWRCVVTGGRLNFSEVRARVCVGGGGGEG
jgi:hypothetical protein